MNKEQFISFLQEPSKLHAETVEELNGLIQDFPYFQSARILLVLNLFKEKNIRFDSELKTTAIYAGSRNILKKHIDRLGKERIRIKVEKEAVKAERAAPATSATPQREEKTPAQPSTASETTAPDAAQPSQSSSEEDTIAKLKKIIEERIREIEEEKKSKSEKPEKKKITKKTKTKLIDDFIAKEPTITRPKNRFYDPVAYAKQSITEQEEIVSETLAKIYFDQGYFEKAVKMYEKLILKYPEKSSYFAALIEKANNELNNQK